MKLGSSVWLSSLGLNAPSRPWAEKEPCSLQLWALGAARNLPVLGPKADGLSVCAHGHGQWYPLLPGGYPERGG